MRVLDMMIQNNQEQENEKLPLKFEIFLKRRFSFLAFAAVKYLKMKG